MEILILADYYEYNLLIKKATRLRKRNHLVVYSWYNQYTCSLARSFNYGYDYSGDAYWFSYGSGLGYRKGNGAYYKYNN